MPSRTWRWRIALGVFFIFVTCYSVAGHPLSVTLHQINPNAWIVCPRYHFLALLFSDSFTQKPKYPNLYLSCLHFDRLEVLSIRDNFRFLFLFLQGLRPDHSFWSIFETRFPLLIALCRLGIGVIVRRRELATHINTSLGFLRTHIQHR